MRPRMRGKSSLSAARTPRGGEVHVDEEEAALFFRVDEGGPVFETAPFFGHPEAGGDFRGVFFGGKRTAFRGR